MRFKNIYYLYAVITGYSALHTPVLQSNLMLCLLRRINNIEEVDFTNATNVPSTMLPEKVTKRTD
jgi:hypothetical protein